MEEHITTKMVMILMILVALDSISETQRKSSENFSVGGTHLQNFSQVFLKE